MRRKRLLGLGPLLLTLAWGISPDEAGAATATTTFQVTANVLVACTIAATPMIFGNYTGLKINVQSSLIVTCTNATLWNIGLNEGAALGATVTTRQMTGPAPFFLGYQLSTVATHAVNWGNTVGTDTVSGIGTGGVQIVTVYGNLPGGQSTAGPGGYVDTITATIIF